MSSPPGAYTGTSKGWEYVRETIADFINKRDGLEGDQMSCANDIYLSNGASEAVRLIFTALVRNDNDGVLVPIPEYPLYSALLTLSDATLIPYFLNEEKNWDLDVENLQEIVDAA